jgi:glutathione S-transferase
MAPSGPTAAHPLQPPLPVLYSFRRCPYAMRARLALADSGMVCELREVVLARKPAALLLASPKGTVPVLVLQNGAVLEQSLDIMLYALRQSDPWQWLPSSEQDLSATLALIAQCDSSFKANLDRHKYPNRYALPDGLGDRAEGAVFLQMLNDALATQSFLHGAHFGLADAAIAPFVRQFAHTDTAWFARQPWSALAAWLAAFETSKAYLHVMDKVPTWFEGQSPWRFPAL